MKKSSCETQLISTVEETACSLDKGEQTELIMDFSKAFDSVLHQRLLKKLRYCGIRGVLNTCLTEQQEQVYSVSPFVQVLLIKITVKS